MTILSKKRVCVESLRSSLEAIQKYITQLQLNAAEGLHIWYIF